MISKLCNICIVDETKFKVTGYMTIAVLLLILVIQIYNVYLNSKIKKHLQQFKEKENVINQPETTRKRRKVLDVNFQNFKENELKR